MPERKSTSFVPRDKAMERVKYYIDKFTSNTLEGTRTGAVLCDVAGSGGKMIRPRLLLLCSTFGPDQDAQIETLCMYAAMIEMTHMASLIHDDIVDEASYRRGKPSIQKKYGKDAAVYAGDFLISRVNYWLAVEHQNDVAAQLSKTVEEMCMGEIGQAMHRYDAQMTVDQYLKNIKGKTASLFRAACMIGAAGSGCDQETVANLGKLGEYIGIIFQLRDDLLDFTSDSAAMGKETHKDFYDGIYTMPVLLARQATEDGELLKDLMEKNSDRKFDRGDIALLEQAVKRGGGIEGTIARIHEYTSICRKLLDSMMTLDSERIDTGEDSEPIHREKEQSVLTIRRMLDRFDDV